MSAVFALDRGDQGSGLQLSGLAFFVDVTPLKDPGHWSRATPRTLGRE